MDSSAAFNTGNGSPAFQDITAKLVNGTFVLTASDLATILEATLTDGTYNLLVRRYGVWRSGQNGRFLIWQQQHIGLLQLRGLRGRSKASRGCWRPNPEREVLYR